MGAVTDKNKSEHQKLKFHIGKKKEAYQVLVIEKLGEPLNRILRKRNENELKFSMKTVCMLAIQLVSILTIVYIYLQYRYKEYIVYIK